MSERGLIYTSHFGLKTLPFENVPDPAFFFGQGGYDRVLEHLIASCEAGRGLMVVLGPIGSGKTTLSQKIMFSVPVDTKLIWMAEPPDSSNDFFHLLAQELGSENPTSQPRSITLLKVRDRLFDLYKEGRKCLVIVDEVHKISDDVLEAVRLLNNLEYGASKLIQLLLLGQDEFMPRLEKPELSNFRQRIAALEVVGQMNTTNVRDYILHRLNVAGSRSEVFSDVSIDAIANVTGGIPRLTNSLCDRALRACFYRGKVVVDLADVKLAAQELGDAGLDRKLFFYLRDHNQVNQEAEDQTPKVAHPPLHQPNKPRGRSLIEDAIEKAEQHQIQIGLEVKIKAPELDTPSFSRPPEPLAAEGNASDFATAISPDSTEESGSYPEHSAHSRPFFPQDLRHQLIILAVSIFIFAVSLWFFCENADPVGGSCLEKLLELLRPLSSLSESLASRNGNPIASTTLIDHVTSCDNFGSAFKLSD